MTKKLPLEHWSGFQHQTCAPLEGGLINGTWQVGEPPIAVIQSLSPIFRPEVNLDIAAITQRLSERGVLTPELLPTDTGDLWFLDEEGCCWRALNWLPGVTYSKVAKAEMAFEAGAMVARWHAALEDFEHDFQFSRPGAHDTLAHMQHLEESLEKGRVHRLYDQVGGVAEQILGAWRSWEGRLDGPQMLSHGDLKISNLRFDAHGKAIALLDLDTMGYLSLDVELGDALRSWCNRSAEDAENCVFDLANFQSAAEGYLSERTLNTEEQEALPRGVERICLELASRFAADALNESYFGWNPSIAPTQGEHNLLRARGQLSLAQSVRLQIRSMEDALR